MSVPYGQQYGGQPSPYGDQQSFQDPQQQQQLEGEAPPPAGVQVAEIGKKKKRAYAADAFNVGTAGNVGGGLGQTGRRVKGLDRLRTAFAVPASSLLMSR